MLNLNTPVAELTRVGKATASKLKKLGIEKAGDLLYYYPFRYEDYSQVVPIAKLQGGQQVTIKARIEIIENKRSQVKKKLLTEAMVADEAGDKIKIVWFNQAFLTKTLHPGDWVYLAGKVDYDGWGFQLTSPSYEKIESWRESGIHTARLVPIYSVTANLTEKQIRFLTKMATPLANDVEDFLPSEIKKELNLIDLDKALLYIHFPENSKQLEQARERLKFDELFLIQLQAQRIRAELNKSRSPEIKFMEAETKSFVESLPFKLTDAQRKSAWEIIKDLGKRTPMNRLLEGDVGSGKTVVAVLAGLNVIRNGFQVILMAPTEILAKQHYENIRKLFRNFKIEHENQIDEKLRNNETLQNLEIRNREIRDEEEKEIKKQGKCEIETLKPKKIKVDIFTRMEKSAKINKDGLIVSDFVIGTHALIQENVKFKNLGLTIIDEQQRFGVEQRKRLKEGSIAKPPPTPSLKRRGQKVKNLTDNLYEINCPPLRQGEELKEGFKNFSPHFLSMTATPIPRSLALSLYGDLDLSIIDEMPGNRKKIITKVVDSKNYEETYQFIHEQIKAGRQVFVVCPLINESEKLEVKSAEEEYEKIDKQIFPHLRVGILHGKLKPKEKEQVRKDFWRGKLDILVATAVVEVGIDVPNASVMMIEGADRFGLAQLHQFRGRVGRSEHQSYCFLFTGSDSLNTKKRLEALLTAKNGFELAEKDLEIRGPGEVYGKNQSGFLSSLKIAKLTDYEIIKKAKAMAEKIIKKDPEFLQYSGLRKKIRNFEESTHLE